MRAYLITLGDTTTIESSRAVGNEFEVEEVPAAWPSQAEEELVAAGLAWAYPWDTPVPGPCGMTLHPYTTRNRLARMACFMSHYWLWKRCASGNETSLILEEDALFTERLPADFDLGRFGMVSINDPRGATRRAAAYHAKLRESGQRVAEAPMVDAPEVPQGLPGHSAYLLAPEMARLLMEKAAEVGAWPNDALACRQLFPHRLGCSTTYYTRVSGRQSTLA